MIYLDWGATSFPKPAPVRRAVMEAMVRCANPGRGGHAPAMAAAEAVYTARERAGKVFDCAPEQVVFTSNCTHGLNMAIRSLFRPGDRVLISGFEHNAVTRPLYNLGAKVQVAGRKLFDWVDTLEDFDRSLRSGCRGAVFTHVSNVFGYILPVEEMAKLCRDRGVPFVIDAAQSAGSIPISLKKLGADFIAMPGHKGLLGPQGTGILLCGNGLEPLMMGGTGGDSRNPKMPEQLPERGEAGTVNVPGIAGLGEGLRLLQQLDIRKIGEREQRLIRFGTLELEKLGYRVFSGPHQLSTLSFLPEGDCEEVAERFGKRGFALRAGLHCAPLAHESAGTLETGTIRLSLGHSTKKEELEGFVRTAAKDRGRLH